jgi:NADPH-dependent 2,4-dienoyl-CoA reductase/sulfur reductase-like enzyme
MEAARLARLRGHDVSLWEQDTVIGGKLDVASRAPSKSEVLRFRDYQTRTLQDLGVDVHTDAHVTADVIADENPDVVVVATGAEPLFPPIPGIDGPTVVDAQELLYRRIEVAPGTRVVIVGGSATGCETAELLLEFDATVSIVEMLASIGRGIEQITRRHLVRTLRKGGVQIVTNAKVTAIEPGRVIHEPADGDGDPASIDADIVAIAVGWRPRGAQLTDLLGDRELVVVGDADRPADFVAAVAAGAAAGRAV